METHPDDPVLALAERVARVEPRLSELARLRLLARIHGQIEAEQRRARTRGPALATLALLSAACVLCLWQWPARQAPQASVKSARESGARAAPSVPPVGVQDAPALIPYLVAGTDAARAAALLDRAQTELSLGPHERVLATLGDRARIAVLGPAELRVSSAGAARVEIALLRGTLLGDYDHAREGALRVRAPDLVSEIVGTIFLVQASPGASRTAVLQGSVRVQVAGRGVYALHDLQELKASDGAVVALNTRDAQVLRAHAQSIAPPSTEHGTLRIKAPNLLAELDGRPLSETPFWLAVAPGSHLVTLRAPGKRPRTFEARVRAGELAELASGRASELAARKSNASHAVEDADAGPTPQGPRASDLYGAAESAMRSGEHAQARALLARLVEAHPSASERDLALYELAELSLRSADYDSAQTWLEQLERLGPRPALRESADFLRCRLLRARKDSEGLTQCLTQFHARFPASPHK